MARVKDYPQLRTWLLDNDRAALLEFIDRQPRALSFLTALTYDQDSGIAWRAVEASGMAAARLTPGDPELVTNHLRRLLWSLNDESGGIGWRAAETIGEIIHNRPQEFKDFIPLVLSLLEMEAEQDAARFRPGVLWAIGRIAQVSPQVGLQVLPRITGALQDDDAQVRGMALWCLSQFEHAGSIPGASFLLEDHRLFEVYEQGEIHKLRISETARKVVGGSV